MNRALQSWSPRTRPLNYDALQQDVGCQNVKYGAKVYASLPFSRICIFDHTGDPNSPFNYPDTVSFTVGPENTGDPLPWSTIWAAWVSSEGVRITKLPAITLPSNDLGMPSSFYPDTKPTKLSIGFTSLSQVAIAIQRSEATIEIKWLKSTDGTNLQTVSFLGVSPVLQSNSLLQFGVDRTINDLVLYYLRGETSGVIYARFEREDFSKEYAVNSSLQADVSRLVTSIVEGSKQVMYARDVVGRDISLYSNEYVTIADKDKVSLAVQITGGGYAISAVTATIAPEKMTLKLAVAGGKYSDPIQEPDDILSGDKNTLTLSVIQGEYI